MKEGVSNKSEVNVSTERLVITKWMNQVTVHRAFIRRLVNYSGSSHTESWFS